MPSFLSRLRTRAVSTSTVTSEQSALSATTTPIRSPIIISPTTPATPPTSPLAPLNRRIHPDVNSLLASYSEQQDPPVALGLRPSSRRHSDGSSPRLTELRRTLETQEEVSEPDHSREVSLGQVGEDASRTHWLVQRISQLASPGEWSTFGRSRAYTSPKIGDFSDPPATPRQPSRPTSAGRSTPSARTTGSHRSSVKPPSSQSQESKRSSNQQSITPSRSTPPKVHISSLAASELGFDSPRTFGQPSPEAHTFSCRPSSPPPPLPLLNHPSLPVRSGVDSDSTIPSTARHETDESHAEPKTYPRRSQSSRDPALSSFPFSKGRTRSKSTPTSTHPKVQKIFQTSPTQTPIASTDVSDPKHDVSTIQPSRPRIRTISGRRLSADWSSRQAAENKYSWPAQVSREIVQLSFGRRMDMDGMAPPADNDHNSRGTHVGLHNTHNLPVTFSSFTSSHHPPPLLLPSLQSPFSFQDSNSNLSTNSDHDSSSTSRDRGMPDRNDARQGERIDSEKTSKKGKAPQRPASSSPVNASTSDAGADPLPTQPLQPPELSFTAPTPETPLASLPPTQSKRRSSQGRGASTSAKAISESSVSKGKRKAEEDDESTPSDSKKESQHAKFAVPESGRQNRTSSSSHAPSSYHRKRARLSPSTPLTSQSESRPSSSQGHDGPSSGRPGRPSSRQPSNRSVDRHLHPRTSMSQTSIPISALVSPHAPSISHSGKFHMQDPRKPRKIQPTGWSLRFASEGEPGTGSPFHAWFFFLGFVIFPIWWVASFWKTPTTRQVGGSDVEKAVTLDDPQVEFDAKSWRSRCRFMSCLSFVTYIPFIVLVAVFEHR